ncbi:PQQ-binding-like beta-propeller repeat protein [Streptomyces sp. ME19-01-6]|uniref:outer membrane protein assembly factor BamB family protein n=1 Tax=Streptomyces sp. ME19-01-6 TaxID=3028686 RepID=UPI0029AEA941|nr:PQQ-binding-like beta-propeller repeat protein [Streptomyces sp. ME19-01-6]MDX3232127.1 PQQ-binding-like beta-propeller repeat protein [Streptomyces sp. ME19-01-6]
MPRSGQGGGLPSYPQQPPESGAPGAPWPPPPPVPPRRGGGKVATVIAIVVLLLAGGITVALFKHDSSASDDSATPAAKQSSPPAHALRQKWQTELPESHVLGNLSGLPALWRTIRGPVYADDNGVRAFDPETGKTLWTVKTPDGASEVCAIAPQPNSEGVGAAVYDAGGNDCAFLVVFDTETGRTLWSKNLSSGYKTVAPRVEVGEDTVVASIGVVSAYAISGGAKKWTVHSRGRDCGNDIEWSSRYLAYSSSCSDVKPEDELSILDLRYGDTWKFPNEKRDVEQVVGDDPLTLVLVDQEGSDDAKRYLQTYTEDGKPDKSFRLTGKLANVQFGNTTIVDRDESVLLSNYDDTAGLGATDLKTGKVLWSKRQMRQVGLTDDGKVIALKASKRLGGDPTLVALGLRDGEEESRGVVYTPKHSLNRVDMMSAGWWGDTLYVIGHPSDDPQGKLVLRAFDTFDPGV